VKLDRFEPQGPLAHGAASESVYGLISIDWNTVSDNSRRGDEGEKMKRGKVFDLPRVSFAELSQGENKVVRYPQKPGRQREGSGVGAGHAGGKKPRAMHGGLAHDRLLLVPGVSALIGNHAVGRMFGCSVGAGRTGNKSGRSVICEVQRHRE